MYISVALTEFVLRGTVQAQIILAGSALLDALAEEISKDYYEVLSAIYRTWQEIFSSRNLFYLDTYLRIILYFSDIYFL